MPLEKTEHVIGPHGGSEIPEAMALLRRVAVRRIDLDVVRFTSALHRGREHLARREVVVVRRLEKENRNARGLNCARQARPQRRRLRPALSASRRIDGGAVVPVLGAEYRFDPPNEFPATAMRSG